MAHVHELHEAKDYIHNLGSSLVKFMGRHKNCVDLENDEDVTMIFRIGRVAEALNHVCECVKHLCDHHDGSMYHMEDAAHDDELSIHKR